LLRDIVGFLAGGLLAALLSCVVFLVFFPLPAPKPTDHTREALAMLVFVNFCCGGLIGRRAFSANFISQLLVSIGGSYAVMVLLCVIASLDFSETARMVALASSGILPSAAALFVLGQRFPAKPESYQL